MRGYSHMCLAMTLFILMNKIWKLTPRSALLSPTAWTVILLCAWSHRSRVSFHPPNGEWLGSVSSFSQRPSRSPLLASSFSQLCCLPAEFSHNLHLLLKWLLSHVYFFCGYLSQHSEDQLFPPSVVPAFFGLHPSWRHPLPFIDIAPCTPLYLLSPDDTVI